MRPHRTTQTHHAAIECVVTNNNSIQLQHDCSALADPTLWIRRSVILGMCFAAGPDGSNELHQCRLASRELFIFTDTLFFITDLLFSSSYNNASSND
jgi:hypothetical protein